jgi:hypothetical protein
MRYCHKCKVKVLGSPHHCPLCGRDLDGPAEPERDAYPVIPPPRPASKGLVPFFAFGTIIVAVLSAAVNIAFFSAGIWWFIFVLAGLGSLWLSFLALNTQWWNIPRTIFIELLLISVLVLGWDFFNGFYKWSLNFVIPILFSCAMVVMTVFAKVRKLPVQDYIIFLGLISVVSIFALLLIIFQVVTPVVPAMVCFAVSLISLAFLFLFDGASLREELRRRMHL